MPSSAQGQYRIRLARPPEYSLLGQLTVDAYASLAGMPSAAEQPNYYQLLRDVSKRALNPAISVWVAANDSGELFGSIDFITDMTQYGSIGLASTLSDSAGIRLLAVKADHRGKGIGSKLTAFCIDRAWELGSSASPPSSCIRPGQWRRLGRCMSGWGSSAVQISIFSKGRWKYADFGCTFR